MDIRLAYGKTGLTLHTDPCWNVQVVEPRFVPGVEDAQETLGQALRSPIGSRPLSELIRKVDRVGIIVNDITRATPSPLILRAILTELAFLPRENVTIFNALGTHRSNSEAEMRATLGDEIVDQYRIVQNNCFEQSTQVYLGTTSCGNEIWINRELIECQLKILTGFIEPHFFAGFSGGGKAIMPGMAGLRTVQGNHSAANIAHPDSTWGKTRGNPIWEEVHEVARKAGRTLLVNVTLNRDKNITRVFAGELEAAHAAGCVFAREIAMVPVDAPYDIVITSNSGYPLDQNLYQSVKGMSAAERVVKPGGAIVVVAECQDGIPDHGLYGQLLRESSSPQDILDKIFDPDFQEQDQWQAQIQAQILLKADVYMHSRGLSAEQIKGALLKPAPSLEATLVMLVKRYGPQARICVLPEGPVTIPYLQSQN